jgi:hypothetical protein
MGNFTQAEMTRLYGPSFANSRAAFEQAFGSEEYLLEETNKWIGYKPRAQQPAEDQQEPEVFVVAATPGNGEQKTLDASRLPALPITKRTKKNT